MDTTQNTPGGIPPNPPIWLTSQAYAGVCPKCGAATDALSRMFHPGEGCEDHEQYKRILALAKHLGEDPDEVQKASYGENTYEFGRQEWLVLTDEEADERARDYIHDSVWAFRPEFLIAHMPRGMTTKAIKLIQQACEDANEPLSAMLVDRDHFVDDAIRADGRGHFLSSYDGEENESEGYFLYRVN